MASFGCIGVRVAAFEDGPFDVIIYSLVLQIPYVFAGGCFFLFVLVVELRLVVVESCFKCGLA